MWRRGVVWFGLVNTRILHLSLVLLAFWLYDTTPYNQKSKLEMQFLCIDQTTL